ncbi:hypothetical protein P9112_003552 [Eukaryota sp. TZLM1-RC]
MLGLFPFESDEVYDEDHQFNRSDQVLLGADSTAFLIDQVLDGLERTRDCLFFLVGDNCPTNHRLADILSVPFIGCASHRMALEVKRFSSDTEVVLCKLDKLFTELRHVKNSIILKNISSLRPLKRNTTRWSSAIEMIRRHLQFLDNRIYGNFGPDVGQFVLSQNENAMVRQLARSYEDFNSVTKFLQGNGVSLYSARTAFNLLHEDYPGMVEHTSLTSSIVHSPTFEAAIVKILEGNEDRLSHNQRSAVVQFLKTNVGALDSQSPASPLSAKLAEVSSSSMLNSSRYIDLTFIPPTSNEIERLFSRAKLTVGCLRTRLSPFSLEKQLFLLNNKTHWSENTIKLIMLSHPYATVSQGARAADEDLD